MSPIADFLRRYVRPPFKLLESVLTDGLGMNPDHAENIVIILFLITISSPLWLSVIALYSVASSKPHDGDTG